MKNPNRELPKLNKFKPGKEREEFLLKVKAALAEYKRRWEAGEITRYDSQHRPHTLARFINPTNPMPDRVITAVIWVINHKQERAWITGKEYQAKNGATVRNGEDMHYDTSKFGPATATPALREAIWEDYREWARNHPLTNKNRRGANGPPGFLGPKYGFDSDQSYRFSMLSRHPRAEEYRARFISGESIADLWVDYKSSGAMRGKPLLSVRTPIPAKIKATTPIDKNPIIIGPLPRSASVKVSSSASGNVITVDPKDTGVKEWDEEEDILYYENLAHSLAAVLKTDWKKYSPGGRKRLHKAFVYLRQYADHVLQKEFSLPSMAEALDFFNKERKKN